MTIYTVSSCDDHPKLGDDHCTIGSYTTRGRALDECVDYIMERLRTRDDLAFCMANDENHPEAKEFFSGHYSRSDSWRVKRGKARALRAYLRDELGGQGCYYACLDAGMGWISFHFDIDENDVEGELWHTVTWGDSDCEDPDFTTPFPELFTDEDKAIDNAVQYAKDLMDSHDFGPEDEDRAVQYLEAALREDGEARLDLNDGAAVHWVLYHFGMETENTDAKKAKRKGQPRRNRRTN